MSVLSLDDVGGLPDSTNLQHQPPIDLCPYDATFLATFVAVISIASVFASARPPQRGKNLSRKYFLWYDLAQLVSNGLVCVRLLQGLDHDVFGFNTADTQFVRRTVKFHYYAKYLDLLFTALLIISQKWEKLGVGTRGSGPLGNGDVVPADL